MFALQDTFERKFAYLRLSVTEACNFRCVYCLPNGLSRQPEPENYLSVPEIRRLVSAFSGMGFWKIRITGGEPTLRVDILEIAKSVAEVPGVTRVALSTNAYRLKKIARDLKSAGVTHLNVSLDSLDRETFHEITGFDKLSDVLSGIETALGLGFAGVKVNAVLMKGRNDEALSTFQEWIRDIPVSVRFIELMRTGENENLFSRHHAPATFLQEQLLVQGWKRLARLDGDGPAVEFRHPDYAGAIGIIAPYSPDFCSTCNRLRISSRGDLRLCLFGEGGYSLRHLLQSDDQEGELQETVHRLMGEKKESHYLQEGQYGSTRNFASIGG